MPLWLNYYKMTKIITHIIISSCMLVFFTANDARPASRPEFLLQYKEGMITLKGDRIPIMPLLEKITEVSSIEIFLIDDIDSRSINVDFRDRSLEDALRSILKDCSYAILYFNDISSKGKIHTMSAYARKNNILPALAAGKAYRSKKRKISEERTNQVMDHETGREIDAFMRQAGSHTPEQINMVMEEFKKEGIRETAIPGKSLQSSTSVRHLYSDFQSSSRSSGANTVPDNRDRNGNSVHGKSLRPYPVLGKFPE